jgi:rhomboid protease GluP
MVDRPTSNSTDTEAQNPGYTQPLDKTASDSQMPTAEASAPPMGVEPVTQSLISADSSNSQDLKPISDPHSDEFTSGSGQENSKVDSKIQLPSSFEPIRLKIGTILLLASLLVIPGILLSRGSNPFDIGPFDAINFGANLAPMVLAGEPWRMLSSLFMHFGIAHLALNFLGLALFGYELEKRTGALGLIAVFILTGIAGSAAHVAWYALGLGQVSLAAGASGGILGLNGLLLVLSAAKPNPRALFNTKALLWLGAINLGYGFVTPGIDNAAHIGGFLAGALLGAMYLLYRLVRR